MGQLGNPSHLDRGRVIVPASLLAGWAAGELVWRVLPLATFWLCVLTGAAVCVLVAWRLGVWFERRASAARVAKLEAARAEQVAETERRLVAMRGKV